MINKNHILFIFLAISVRGGVQENGLTDFSEYGLDDFPDYDLGIAGGEDADIADYPYMLLLAYQSRENIYCGAVLISPQWALTTAVCTDRLSSPDEIVVLANSSYYNSSAEFGVARIVQNPNYEVNFFNFDISLLELKEPLDCTYCQPVPLRSSTPDLGQNGTLTGFGWTVQIGNYSDVLQVLNGIPVANWTECKDIYYGKKDVTENMFCAGFFENNTIKDFCQGDIGSPLVIEGGLAGLASWGYGCSDSIWPGVYTNVYIFIDWILEYVPDVVIIGGDD